MRSSMISRAAGSVVATCKVVRFCSGSCRAPAIAAPSPRRRRRAASISRKVVDDWMSSTPPTSPVRKSNEPVRQVERLVDGGGARRGAARRCRRGRPGPCAGRAGATPDSRSTRAGCPLLRSISSTVSTLARRRSDRGRRAAPTAAGARPTVFGCRPRGAAVGRSARRDDVAVSTVPVPESCNDRPLEIFHPERLAQPLIAARSAPDMAVDLVAGPTAGR